MEKEKQECEDFWEIQEKERGKMAYLTIVI